ncbi:Tri1p NDAI_0K00880 [Naumovozyma dairenensis CBS 421]|uniref:Uncharacterized protein n=1 Tax=Naumovozyma dairenensis (strain ATCC 10597 / BCRC 20456 / CBS 421 / NBRC 0211 / NRRL Y-12639) TaxID=1071378 RepID=G0WHL8_NAUDC|nr:hypothetical protein NDAI_0K00880 [Naumovozyma dairenensis CBS 421]CCD27279.1 hypothetical protein NDAI_0K00880 [Naumovozyma dairenensis CBS 421]
MKMSDLEKYIPMIDAILSASNPDEVSPKKIRRAIQELFAVDLDPRRKAFNELIINRFNYMQDHPKDEAKTLSIVSSSSAITAPSSTVDNGSVDDDTRSSKDKKNKKKKEKSKIPKVKKSVEQIDKDHELAMKLQEEGDSDRLRKRSRSMTQSKESSPVKIKKKSIKKKSGENGKARGLSAHKVILSGPLSELLGGEKELARTQVVKQVWNYIKENKLQNPNDRREILCDSNMEPIFGKKMTMFSMNKILSNHLFNPEELVNEGREE